MQRRAAFILLESECPQEMQDTLSYILSFQIGSPFNQQPTYVGMPSRSMKRGYALCLGDGS
jgi:hypothetical protein